MTDKEKDKTTRLRVSDAGEHSRKKSRQMEEQRGKMVKR